jgi:hypothetical protein
MATTLNITGNTVLKTSPGKVIKVTGVVTGVVGTINDAAAAGGTNYICGLPALGQSLTLDWPTFVGITVNISAGAVSVQWE